MVSAFFVLCTSIKFNKCFGLVSNLSTATEALAPLMLQPWVAFDSFTTTSKVEILTIDTGLWITLALFGFFKELLWSDSVLDFTFKCLNHANLECALWFIVFPQLRNLTIRLMDSTPFALTSDFFGRHPKLEAMALLNKLFSWTIQFLPQCSNPCLWVPALWKLNFTANYNGWFLDVKLLSSITIDPIVLRVSPRSIKFCTIVRSLPMQMVSTLGLHFMLSFILSLIFPSKLEAHIKYVAEENSCQCCALDFPVIDNVRKLELWVDTVGSHFWVCKSAHLSSQSFWFSVKSFISQWLVAFLKINILRIVLYGGAYDQPFHKKMLRLWAHCLQLTDLEIEECDSIFAWRYCKGGVCGAWLEVF